VALAANALTTVAALESLLGIGAGSATARCEQVINAASDAIEKHCGREFARQVGKVEQLAGFDGQRLYLALSPVESVAGVTFDGSAIDASSYTLFGKEGYLYRRAGWVSTAVQQSMIDPMQLPGSEERRFAVTYTGGYALAQNNRTPGTFTQPYDLEEACLALAAYRFRQTPKNPALTAEQAGNASRAYGQKGIVAMPDYVAEMLEPYMRIR
jgi:hypothetical protein